MAAGLLLAGLAGCEFSTRVEQYGVFTLKTDMVANRLDWEGGNTSRLRSHLCSSLDGRCETADGIGVSWAPDETRQHDRIAVWTEEGSRPRRLSFRDATTGAALACANCDTPLEPQISRYAQDVYGRFEWSPSGAFGLAQFPVEPGHIRLVLLSFDATGYRATTLGDWATHTLPGTARFSPDESALGWYVCDSRCELFAYARASRQLTATPVACPYNTYLDIGWLGARAYAEHYWGTSATDRCLTPDGRTALPRGAGDRLQARDDDPPHPTSESDLPSARLVTTL